MRKPAAVNAPLPAVMVPSCPGQVVYSLNAPARSAKTDSKSRSGEGRAVKRQRN